MTGDQHEQQELPPREAHTPATAPEENRIIATYSALIVTLVLMTVSHYFAGLLASVMLVGVMIYAYHWRRKSAADSLTADHMRFIIRTIWIGSAIAALTTAIGAAYLLANGDMAPLMQCSQGVADKIMQGGTAINTMDTKALSAQMQPCITAYLRANDITVMIALLVAALPPLFYFALRITRGFGRARRGHRIGVFSS